MYESCSSVAIAGQAIAWQEFQRHPNDVFHLEGDSAIIKAEDLMTEQPGLVPHRGGVILALGILGLVTCGILGIIAWIMGNDDLRKMDTGIMDPGGRDLTQAGKICGMVATFLLMIPLGIIFVVLIAGTVFRVG